MKSKYFYIFLALEILVFGGFSLIRPLSYDEGFYGQAIQQVSLGKLPYLDFPFPQMPLFPYLHLPFLKIFGFSLYAARLNQALWAILTGILIYLFVKKRYFEKTANLIGILYIFNFLVLGRYTTVETYALSTLLAFSGFWLGQGKSPLSSFLSGLSLGILANLRLLLAPLIILGGIQILFFRKTKPFLSFLNYLLAVLLTSIFSFWLYFKNPQTFIFLNVGRYLERDSKYFILRLENKLANLGQIFNQAQFLIFLILVTLAIAYLFSIWKENFRKYQVEMASLVFAVAIVVLSFIPSPFYSEYLSPSIPFFLIAVTPFLEKNLQRNILIGGFFLIYLLAFPVSTFHHVGEFYTRFDQTRILPLAEQVSREVTKIVKPGEEFVTSSGVYGLKSKAIPLLSFPAPYLDQSLEHLSQNKIRIIVKGFHSLSFGEIDPYLKDFKIYKKMPGGTIYVKKE